MIPSRSSPHQARAIAAAADAADAAAQPGAPPVAVARPVSGATAAIAHAGTARPLPVSSLPGEFLAPPRAAEVAPSATGASADAHASDYALALALQQQEEEEAAAALEQEQRQQGGWAQPHSYAAHPQQHLPMAAPAQPVRRPNPQAQPRPPAPQPRQSNSSGSGCAVMRKGEQRAHET